MGLGVGLWKAFTELWFALQETDKVAFYIFLHILSAVHMACTQLWVPHKIHTIFPPKVISMSCLPMMPHGYNCSWRSPLSLHSNGLSDALPARWWQQTTWTLAPPRRAVTKKTCVQNKARHSTVSVCQRRLINHWENKLKLFRRGRLIFLSPQLMHLSPLTNTAIWNTQTKSVSSCCKTNKGDIHFQIPPSIQGRGLFSKQLVFCSST